jgi:plastocyanin
MHFKSILPAGLIVAFGIASTAGAQSLLERPPNMSGNWTGAPGTVYFHFIHRFATSDAPERKVSNVPTFLLSAGLPKRIMAGLNYSTNSTLAPRFPNEWELFARWLPLSQDHGAPVDLGGQVGFNNASDGVDGELSVARRMGRLRLLAAGRALADPLEHGNVRFAVGGGAALKLGTYVALAGDVSTLTDRDSSERVAWSAGIHFAIPLTPHTFSLHASNTLVTTLQGISRGSPDVRYGFEFTIPLTLRRYFGSRAEPVVSNQDPSRTVDAAESARAERARQLAADSARQNAVTDSIRSAAAQRDSVLREQTRRDALIRTAADSARARADSIAARTADSIRARNAADNAARARSAPPRPGPPRPGVRTVRTGMRNTAYINARIEIVVGSTIIWTNNDAMPHTVTATDKSFDSGMLNAGKTWQHTFTKPGTYNFYCMPHPFMKGVIVVRAQ